MPVVGGRRWPTRARPCWPGTGPPAAAVAGDRLAGPPRRVGLRGAGRRRAERVAAPHRPGPRPLLLRAQDGVAARPRDHRRRGHHDRHLAGAPAVRRVRHRRLDGQPLAAARPRRRRSGPASCSTCSGWMASRCPTSWPATRSSATTERVRRRRAGDRPDRRPAGGAAGRALPGRRARPSAPSAPARSCWPSSATGAVRSPPGLTTSVAWRLRGEHVVLRGRAGLHRRLGGALGHRARPDRRPPTSSTPSPPRRATGCSACPALAGLARTVVGRRGATASFTGMTLSTGRGHLVRALLRGHRRAGRRADRAGRPTTSARPLTRLRVDGGLTRSRTLMQAQADLAQLPVDVYPSAARHPARRGRLRPARPRPGLLAWPTPSAAGSPTQVYEPRWSADRAAEHLAPLAAAAVAPRAATHGARRVSRRAPSTSPSSAAGIVGAAIARELAGTRLRVALVEARADVGDGTSKANTAILHTGFDATPGTLESRLVARGYDLLGALRRADRHPGRAHRRAARRLDRRGARGAAGAAGQGRGQRVRRVRAGRSPTRCTPRVPALGPGALGGLTVPGRVDHLHLDHHPRPGHRRRRRGARAAARAPGHGGRRRERPDHTVAGHHARRGPRALGRQRGRARRRPPRPDVRPRPVHGHPAPRRAVRLRQARPPAGAADRAAGAVVASARACWSAPRSTAT